ncbi:MAG: c-type cytochrome biogenesis protein CcmF [Rhizobiales bacterium 65-9]|nr:heme lyase CcmF/NrfE family subunit [Hyphomicrobiales bacterium]OJY33143.1 MAG: c-type cytochrome biogenesis protein CcmF [Rhizobiales bacterium 65-9]
MIAEAGHFALLLALALAIVQSCVGLWAGRSRDAALIAMTRSAALGVCAFVVAAFAALTRAYVISDFSVRNVAENSNSVMPLIYKVSGVWGNHEGSVLLWVLVLAAFAASVALRGRDLPDVLRSNVLAVQGMIAALFLAFILATSNPFSRIDPAPFEGADLNPLLQDLGLAIHPPLLYLGYVGCSIAFSFAVAALIDGRIDAVWAKHVRPWTLAAWIFLTLGIAMGSYWAYYELGWGGFWFWDPVENASLMPWLAATALLHSAVVMEKREALKIWTVLLAIVAFSLSLIGTFLVRSGVLTSVHAFAVDPARGVFILGILVVTIGGSLTLFAWRAPMLKHGGLFAPVSREGALVFNNLFLAAACAAVFIGTLYPLALEALTGAKISVGPPFFNMTVIPLMAPLIIAMPLGQNLAWKRGDLLGAAQRVQLSFAVAVAAAAIIAAATWGGPVLAPIAIGGGVWLIVGSFSEIGARVSRGAPSALASRLIGLPRSAFGTAVAHAGVGVTVIGLAATAWHVERIATMRSGDMIDVGAYRLRLDSITPRTGANYREDAARFTILKDSAEVGSVVSAKRIYPIRQMPTTEAGLWTHGIGQVYVSLGEIETDGSVAVRVYDKPLVLLIWLGAVVMAIGGALSLSDRRRRVGAPRPARAPPAMAPAE